ncbi:MAG: glycoside hydrolase family 3 protein [Clostridiales bacterium]|nr:glycoside hydrolase family 3 protein [Clostridiales bacterium]
MVNLKAKPFFLNDEDIRWVEETKASLTMDEKVSQLFNLVAYSDDEGFLNNLASGIKPGGVMLRPMKLEECIKTVKLLQNCKVPMLISANIEKGGTGIVHEGTLFGSPLSVAATDDDETAYRLGTVCGAEGAAAGANWSYAPIIDIDYNFRNPITNTRTFGSDPERVKRMGVQYVKSIQKQGVAACIKHFPGDGVDERDQHLVVNVNDLSCEEWDQSYGEVYKACIEEGSLSCMIGHIMLPEYSRKLVPGIRDEEILPATLAKEITTTLLRERLGFNGLIISDATSMAGMAIPMPRNKAVPRVIAAGCDMFLFTRNMEEDFAFMKKGIEDGVITEERLEDALTRILGMKAALKLHRKHKEGTLVPQVDKAREIVGNAEFKTWAEECADKTVTLVKEQKGILPISPDKYKRVLFYAIEAEGGFFGNNVQASDKFEELLRKEGYEVERFNPNKGMEGLMTPLSAFTDNYDLIIYLSNLATKSNQTVVRIEWAQPMGANVPVYGEIIPTIFISVENPYHLLDVPRVKTYINTYSSGDAVLASVIDKLSGRSEFKGKSPVDPFCGKWDTRL